MKTILGLSLYVAKTVGLCFVASVGAEALFWSVCLHGLALIGALPFVVRFADRLVFTSDAESDPAFRQ